MKTILVEPVKDAVHFMRKVRDEISNEIQDMTFAEERAFLDKLLKADQKATIKQKFDHESSKS